MAMGIDTLLNSWKQAKLHSKRNINMTSFHAHWALQVFICVNLWADCQWCTLVPLFDNGANAAPLSVPALSEVQAPM